MAVALRDAIARVGSYREVARRVSLSPSALSRLVAGEYPARCDRGELMARFGAVLTRAGVEASDVVWPGTGSDAGAALSTREVTLMQMDSACLQLFGLRRNPFLNDVEDDSDVFEHRAYEEARRALREAVEQRGFCALVAPSGTGKTTVWEGIEGEYRQRPEAVLCRVQMKHKERMTPTHLCRALIYGLLGEDARVPQDQETAGRMLSRALMALRTGSMDRKAVLYIDDAHFATASVLRQLKTFYEEKVGRFRLLGIVLVGLPTLLDKLASFPEVGNRVNVVELKGVPVREYLEFKLGRVGSSLDQLFDANGIEAFLDRYRADRKKPAVGAPLLINATCIRAMQLLHASAAEQGEKITAALMDRLPGARGGG